MPTPFRKSQKGVYDFRAAKDPREHAAWFSECSGIIFVSLNPMVSLLHKAKFQRYLKLYIYLQFSDYLW